MKPTLSLSLLAIASTLTACGPQTPVSEFSPAPKSENMETTADLPIESAQRIVALTSLSADIIYHLDSERLVGIPGSSLFQDRPEFQEIAVVSQGRTPPQLETIVALEPDLVIGARGFHDQALAQLEDTGIPVLATETNGWEDFEQLIQNLAMVTESEAGPLEAQYGACLETIPGEASSVLVLVSRQPLLSPNANSWAGDLLNRFNLQNLTAEMQSQGPIEGYVTLSAEKVLTANPDRLLLVDTGEGIVDQMKSEPFWGDLEAVQANQVQVLDYYGLVNPGSLGSINQACKQLAKISTSPMVETMPLTTSN
jgi:iron complex transport system substrate-binding protein